MKVSQTIRGNLIRFKKYYKVFQNLNINKENKKYLGYPFVDLADSTLPEINQYLKFCSIFHHPRNIYSPSTADWFYTFVCRCFENKTNHKLAVYILYYSLKNAVNITRDKDGVMFAVNIETDDIGAYCLNKLHKIILSNEKYFINKLEEESTDDNWQPNA